MHLDAGLRRHLENNLKNKIYDIIRTVPKSNQKNTGTNTKSTPQTHDYFTANSSDPGLGKYLLNSAFLK